MIIVGLTGCDDCKIYHKIHPEYKYVELSKDKKIKSSNEILEIKKALKRLNFNLKFPVLLTEDLQKLIPRSELVEELNQYKKDKKSCKTCKGRNK